MIDSRPLGLGLLVWALVLARGPLLAAEDGTFTGRYFRGEGDREYLELLDISRRLFDPDPEFQNMPMLYTHAWNGFVEGPSWQAWWIQNSYGPTWCALPFYTEPYVTFLQNAQDLWFRFIGDGKPYRSPIGGHQYVVPDGQLCDAANPEGALHKQGDGRVDIHDFGLEFTAAGIVMQAELLLISREDQAIARYLPLLERSANLIETRRDPKNNLFLAGPAANLLAPSYAGYRKPDGTYDKAYLAGLSVTYIAALDRLIELEKLAGRTEQAALYAGRRDLARKGLPLLATDEGYFVKSVDPDGTKHGVYGAAKHGYFEAVVNHDAICFRVADDAQSRRIYDKIASIPLLRRHQVIITNHPSLDDQYENGGIFGFGIWVNGGHWSTCEARMIMAYYRLDRFADAARSMKHLLTFARRFQMDNPLTGFGSDVWFKGAPINLCYDSFGPPAAMIRGLFEYLYSAEGLTIWPHLPPGITRLEQHFPIRFGQKRLYLATSGTGPVTGVLVNGKPWKSFDAKSIALPYRDTPDAAVIQIVLGEGRPAAFTPEKPAAAAPPVPPDDSPVWHPAWPIMTTNELPLRIGADSHGGSRFLGDIRRARVFSRALSAEEVAALAADKPGGLAKDPALVAEWAFDNAKDGAFANAAGAGLAAKIVGEVPVVDAEGGKAIRLAGKGYLEVARDARLDLVKACTLDAWIRPETMPQGGGRILDKSAVGTSNGYLLDTHPGNSLRVIVERGALSHDARLAAGRWYHVAATVDPDGKRTLFIDGKPAASDAQGTPQAYAPLKQRMARVHAFHVLLTEAGLGDSYEAAHARLALAQLAVTAERMDGLAKGRLKPLPSTSVQLAADKSYYDTALALCDGLEKVLASYEKATDPRQKAVFALWLKTKL